MKNTNTNNELFLPSKTWGNDIYDSISDIALRFLAPTFILSTYLEALSTQAPLSYKIIHVCHCTIWNLSTSFDPHKSVLNLCDAPEIFPNDSHFLSRSSQTSATSNNPSNLTIHFFFILPISLVILYLGACLCVFVCFVFIAIMVETCSSTAHYIRIWK